MQTIIKSVGYIAIFLLEFAVYYGILLLLSFGLSFAMPSLLNNTLDWYNIAVALILTVSFYGSIAIKIALVIIRIVKATSLRSENYH